MKSSEIIRMAMNHPSYLRGGVEGHEYLCHVIINHFPDSFDLCEEHIMESLKGSYALQSHFFDIHKEDEYWWIYDMQSQEYKQAAFVHWNALIEKLEKEGN